MRYLLIVLSASLTLLLPTSLIAGTGSGYITQIIAHEKSVNGNNIGVIMFSVENHDNAPAACPGIAWAFNADDDHGKAMYAMLLSAAAQSKTVSIQGANDCKDWSDRERPRYITINY